LYSQDKNTEEGEREDKGLEHSERRNIKEKEKEYKGL
jgi:hypothetical protein